MVILIDPAIYESVDWLNKDIKSLNSITSTAMINLVAKSKVLLDFGFASNFKTLAGLWNSNSIFK